MHSLYIKKFIIFIVILAFPILSNWLFLYNCGELLPVNEIVKKQLKAKEYSIVGLATRDQCYYYKRALYQNVNPDILILGSSRVMQFKKELFQAKMINVGGAMSSINEGYSFIRDTFETHKPKIVILGLDYWWFNEKTLPPSLEIKPPDELSHRISLRSYLLPYVWIWQNKIALDEYFEIVNPLKLFGNIDLKGIGVNGLLNRNGFASDGSYVYTRTISGKERNIDELFNVSFNRIRNQGSRFEYNDKIHHTHLQNFIALINYIREADVEVIVFIPPLAPGVIKEMDRYNIQYQYIVDLKNKLTAAGIRFYDFHDPHPLNTNDCEFVDGIHGGELVYAKILDEIAKTEPYLRGFINTPYVNNIISQYNNLAMIPRNDLIVGEVDFLKLGCDKSSQYSGLNKFSVLHTGLLNSPAAAGG